MLVLTRKTGQRIMIGNEIVISVEETRGERVRLGIIAPADMPIHREEVFVRIAQEEYQRVERPGALPDPHSSLAGRIR